MPQAIIAAAIAVASTIGEAVTVITTSAALGAAVANGVLALAGAAGIGAFISSWALVSAVASTAFSGKPKVGGILDGGTQVDFKANPNAGVPRVLGRTGVGGIIAHMTTDGAAHKNAHLMAAVVLSLGPIEGVERFTANDAQVDFAAETATTAPYVGAMDMRLQLGAQPSGAFPPPSVPAGTIAEWTDAHKLSGLAAEWYSLNYSSKVFPTGVPKPNWTVLGPTVYDPRLDSTFPGGSGAQRWNDETTWAFAGRDNPFLQALTYLIGTKQNGVRVYGLGLPIAAIDVEAFVEGANVADANGWQIGGLVSSTDPKWDTLVAMLQAGSGMPTRLGGKVSCVVDAPRVSLRTVTGADVIGEAVITGTKGRRDRFNAAVPRFRSEEHQWEIVPGGPVVAATYVTEDGAQRTREIEIPLCQDKDQAAQLVAYQIVNAREAEPIMLPLKPLYMGFKAGDCLTVDEPELLLNGQKVVVTGRGIDPMSGAATLTVRTETDAKHDFALGLTGTAPPTPSLTGIDPLLVAQPGVGAFAATGGALVGAAGSIPALIVTGADDNPNATDVLVRYRLSPAGAWASWASVHVAAVGDAVRIEITGVADGLDYDLEVAYRNARGVVSAWTSLGTHTAGDISTGGGGDGIPPADIGVPPTVTVEQGHDAGGNPFSFLNITVVADTTDTDVQGYLFEISDGTGTVDFFSGNAAFQVRGLVAGATYDVKAKVVDTSGNVSVHWSPTGSQTIATGAGQGANLVQNGALSLATARWASDTWQWSVDPGLGYFFETSTNGSHAVVSDPFPVEATQTYTMSLFGGILCPALPAITAGSVLMDLQWLNAGGGVIGASATAALPQVVAGVGDYSRVTLSAVAPAGAVKAKARIYSTGVTYSINSGAIISQVKVEQGAAFTGFNDLATSGAIYPDGTSIESLRPAEAGATQNKVTRSATTPAGPNSTGDFWVLLDGLGNAVAVRNWNGSAWVTPADLTAAGTAAGIAGQSFLATGNPALGGAGNRIRFSEFDKGTVGWNDGTNPSGLSRSKSTGATNSVPYLQFSATATAAGQEVSVYTDLDRFQVTVGEQLAVSLLAGSTNSQMKYGVQFHKADGSFLSTSTGYFFANNATFPTLGQEMITVPALAVTAYLEVYIDSLAAGSMTGKIAQPYVIHVPAGQTAFPPYVRGDSNAAGADVTAFNTAGAITSQGALATQNAATWSTQVTGSGKPTDNADVTSANTSAGFAGQGALATLNDISSKVSAGTNMTVSTTGGVTIFSSSASASGFYLTGNTNACGGSRTGAGTVTTNTVTLTPHNNTGTVSYAWTTPAAGVSPTSASGAATAFSGFVSVGADIAGTSVCTATDGGSGTTTSFAVSVEISENT